MPARPTSGSTETTNTTTTTTAGTNGSTTGSNGKEEKVTIRPMKTLFIRNIPDDFDQSRCEREFSQFPGFVSFQMLDKGKGSGFLNYDTVENATSAKEEFAKSILKVTFKGSTACDECDVEVTKWVNCPCKGLTFCCPRCLIQHHKNGHAAECIEPPKECQCLQGRKFAGAIRCVCQKISWCSVKCMEAGLESHEPQCVPRRFIPPSLRKRFQKNRDHQNVVKLRSQVTDLKKEIARLSQAHAKEIKALKAEMQKVNKKDGSASPSNPVALSDALLPKQE